MRNEFVFMAGGRANRMGRGVKSVDRTKGLMMLPIFGSKETETIIDRTLRLLHKLESFNESEILFCVGYKKELVKQVYPKSQYLDTYDPDDPDDLIPALLRLVDGCPENENLTVLLADVIWSERALKHFLSTRHDAPLVLYHGTSPKYHDIFGIGINGSAGKELIRRVNREEYLPVIEGEIRWKGHDKVPIRYCRASTMEQWIDLNDVPGKLRIYQVGKVADVD